MQKLFQHIKLITFILAAAPSIPFFWASLRFSATSLLFWRASFSRLFAAAACREKNKTYNKLLSSYTQFQHV